MKPYFLLSILLAGKLVSAQVQLPNTLSPADKVYGLSKFWQEVNYNFIYLNKVDRQKWDSAYKALIPVVQQTPNDYAYYKELQKFCALLKDGHTNIYLPPSIEEMTNMFGDYRLFVANIDGKAIITHTNASKKDEIPSGSEIIAVNGLPTKEYRAKFVMPYISSSTDYVLEDWSTFRLLQGLEGDKYDVKIKKPDGKIFSLQLTHKRTEEKDIYPAVNMERKLLDLKWHPNDIAFLSLNSFSDPKIDTLFLEKLPELYKARALIIDLRGNGGGNSNIGKEILQYLIPDSVLYGARTRTRMHLPAFKAWGSYMQPKDTVNNEWGKKSWLSFNDQYYYNFDFSPDTIHLNAKRLIVPTVILMGHSTASAAEDFLIFAEGQKHMITMGQNSFGSTGQPFSFDLPGGGSARICTKQDTYADGREFVGYGIRPAIEVKYTLRDFMENKDPAKERALEYLNKQLNN